MLDCAVIKSVDMTFELAVRTAGVDAPLAQWTTHFDPKPGVDFSATAYELDQPASEAVYAPGAQLIFRYTAANTTSATAWVPNGDGATNDGRIPSFTLPR
ncbi:MAG: hypothetical protein NT062_16645 [Proteobacteria bacterium]|nr:hypothetical protein [Pseudomonadota bacterium]